MPRMSVLVLTTPSPRGHTARLRPPLAGWLGRVRHSVHTAADQAVIPAGQSGPAWRTTIPALPGHTHLIVYGPTRTAAEVESAAAMIAAAQLAGVPVLFFATGPWRAHDTASRTLASELLARAGMLAARDRRTATQLSAACGAPVRIVAAPRAALLLQLVESAVPSVCDAPVWSSTTRRLAAQVAAHLAGPALQRGDAPAAERWLAPWARLLTNEPAWAVSHATAAALLGMDRSALASLHAALARYPEDRACLAALARVHQRCGEWDLAGTAWSRLLQIEPDDLDARAALASLALLAGRPHEAYEHWHAMQRHTPGEPASRRALAAWHPAERALRARVAVPPAPAV
jgi:hypothetical protein